METARRVSVSAWNGFIDCMQNNDSQQCCLLTESSLQRSFLQHISVKRIIRTTGRSYGYLTFFMSYSDTCAG